jgi:hypothetical protein
MFTLSLHAGVKVGTEECQGYDLGGVGNSRAAPLVPLPNEECRTSKGIRIRCIGIRHSNVAHVSKTPVGVLSCSRC